MWRLVFSLILFLLSLLGLFKAPTNFFWRVAVAVTEFPYIFFSSALIFFIACLFTTKYKTPVLLLTGVSFILYTLPVVRAYARGADLSEDLAAVFPSSANVQQLQQPYSFLKMFSGVGIKKVTPQILAYKQLPEKELSLDFYSAGNAKAPCVIVIHGGSWAEGDSKQLPNLNSYLANRGMHVAALNYRLAPTYKSPAPVEDTKDAIAYLVKNSEKLKIDTNNFILLGRSAGGQIALVAAYSFHNPNIKGVISLYGPADMVWGARIKSNKLVLNTDKVFRDYLGGLIDEVPQKYVEASSCEYVNKSSTPSLLIHGGIDAMVAYGHSVHLSEKLAQNNVQHYFLNLPWATHGCDYNINGPSGQISTYAIERFINSVTTH